MAIAGPSSTVRVLFAGVKWPPETFLARLMSGLAERDFEVTLTTPRPPDQTWRVPPQIKTLITPSWSGSKALRVARTGEMLMSAGMRSFSETRQLYRSALERRSNSARLEEFYRLVPYIGHEWDVIYFPWNITAIYYYHLMDKAPSVISCRGTHINISPHHPGRAWLRDGLATTFQKAAAVHCVSEAIRDEALNYGLEASKSVIIRPAVDPDRFCPALRRRAADGRFRIIATGSVIWRKGYEYALEAVRALVDDGVPVTFDIIGSGDELQRLLYTIADLDLGDHVFLHGNLTPSDVPARLQEADVFLLSSLSEGISNAVLEAMACGLPVVTTAAGGMREAVTDGIEGFVVPPYDAKSIAAALRELWQRPDLREHMGAAARARILRDFRLSDQVDAFADLFRSVA